jgi:D-alanine--poly(phosphoribitol) ligase subunit 1
MPGRTGRDWPVIHLAVAGHATRQPEATALITDGHRISYRTLDAAATAYASEFSRLGVAAGHVVPVLRPRSAQLVAIQLGLLKCGAAYASLNPRWPKDRVEAILGQIQPEFVIGEDTADETVEAAAARATDFPAALVESTAPATVFFTSGTTGDPKGIVAPHQAVTRVFVPGGLVGFGPGHATPQSAPLPWDMYAFELWGQLTSGGTSVLVDGDHLLPGVLRDQVRDCGVDSLWLTTSLFNLFVDEDPCCFKGLGQVRTGGEKLSPRHVRAFLEIYPDIPLRNVYGPAENCMLSSEHVLSLADCDVPGGIPVGTPVMGTTVLILDASDQPCDPGEPGEICVSGPGLAVCYLGNPDLTAEKFPTVTPDGTPVRVYRTGDIGLVDEAGVLHYRGRNDRQVKISGYRIELADIEVAARRLADVRDCVALPLTGPDGQFSRLAMFYLSDRGSAASVAEAGTDPLTVRDQLARLLPSYLVPEIVRWLPRYPVTSNGKLDRSALADLARRPAARRGPTRT